MKGEDTAQQLEGAEKEMARLKGRFEELRRSFLDITRPFR